MIDIYLHVCMVIFCVRQSVLGFCICESASKCAVSRIMLCLYGCLNVQICVFVHSSSSTRKFLANEKDNDKPQQLVALVVPLPSPFCVSILFYIFLSSFLAMPPFPTIPPFCLAQKAMYYTMIGLK